MKVKNSLRLLAAVTSLAMLVSCGESRPEYAYDAETPSLYEAYSDYFHIGTAINSWDLTDQTSDRFNLLVKHYDTFVMENETKPDQIHPTEDTYNFGPTDAFVEFGEANGKILRGHTLVWHSQCPQWFFEDNGQEASADLLVQRMKDHITTIVSRYKGRIDTWDVCNEVLDGGGMRFSDWIKIVGDYDGDGDKYDFIEIAFETAREADPDARLIINDYSLESDSNKAIKMYSMVKSMLEEGVPVDGVGLQMHVGIDMDVEAARENIKILARLKEINPDFVIEVTELDMSCYSWNDSSTEINFSKIEDDFNAKYVELFEMFIDLAEEGLLDSVVFWGFNDGDTWLNGYPVEGRTNYPFLMDAEYRLKSAFWEVVELPGKKS